MTDLWTIMPTRGRPTKARRVWESYERTSVLSRTRMVWVLDMEDPKRAEYDEAGTVFKHRSPLLSDWSGNMVERTNKEAMACAKQLPKDTILGWCADDNEFVTQGWDEQVLDAFKRPDVGFVVPNDGHWKGEKAGVVWTRASIIRALGWFALPTQEHLFVDDAWVELARASRSLAYLPDVLVKHHNPLLTGIGEQDEQGKHANRPELYGTDGWKYTVWKEDNMEEDARKVIACLQS